MTDPILAILLTLAETREIGRVFVTAGAVPNTGWLNDCVLLDGKGFIKTGTDLAREDLLTAHWPLARPPRPIAVASVHQAVRE